MHWSGLFSLVGEMPNITRERARQREGADKYKYFNLCVQGEGGDQPLQEEGEEVWAGFLGHVIWTVFSGRSLPSASPTASGLSSE